MTRFTPISGGEGPENRVAEHDVLIGIGEAARIAGVTSDTIRRWADTGRIPVARTAGGHRRVPMTAVKPNTDDVQKLPAKRTAPHLLVPSVAQVAVDWEDWQPPARLDDNTLAELANVIDGGPGGRGLIDDLADVAARCRQAITERVTRNTGHDVAGPESQSPGLPSWTPRQD